MAKSPKKLGEILIEKGLITDEQLQSALEQQKISRDFLGNVLLKRRVIKEKDLLAVLSEQFSIPCVSLKDRYMKWDLVKKFGASLLLETKAVPLEEDEYSVTVAINNPLDMWVLGKAEEAIQPLKLKTVLATTGDINDVIARYNQYLKESV